MKAPNSTTIATAISAQNQKAALLFDKSQLIKRCLWFAVITVFVVAFMFVFNRGGESLKAIGQLKVNYVLFCFLLLFIDLMLGGWRNHVFIRKLKPGLSQWVSFRANVANMFMGAVTPAHGGAGPAQVYVYMRNGVKFIDAFTVSLINLGATLIFMPLAGLLAILVLDDNLTTGIISVLLHYGFGFFTIFLAAFLLAFWKPLWVSRLISKIAQSLSAVFLTKEQRLLRWSQKMNQNIEVYQQTSRLLLRRNPFLFPLSLLITTFLYLNKYCMQYFILLGLGLQADLLQVIAIQVLIQFMIYFAPSPGGSGFAEMSIAVLFSKIVPASFLPLFTLLQRSYLLFFPAIIGAVVVIRLLQRQAKEWQLPQKHSPDPDGPVAVPK